MQSKVEYIRLSTYDVTMHEPSSWIVGLESKSQPPAGHSDVAACRVDEIKCLDCVVGESPKAGSEDVEIMTVKMDGVVASCLNNPVRPLHMFSIDKQEHLNNVTYSVFFGKLQNVQILRERSGEVAFLDIPKIGVSTTQASPWQSLTPESDVPSRR